MIPILATLIVVGLVLYIVNLLPLDATIKRIIWACTLVAVVLWVLHGFGLLGRWPAFR